MNHTPSTSLLAAAVAGFILSLPSVTFAAPVLAQPSDAFVESIGVGGHIAYSSGPYGAFETVVKPRLTELGIRHMRDGIYPNSSAGGRTAVINKMLDLNSTLGISFTTLFSGDSMSVIDETVRAMKPALIAVEGANETDLTQFNFNYKGAEFPGAFDLGNDPAGNGTRGYQQDLYELIKNHSDPAIRALPVVQTSLGWGGNSGTLGDCTAYTDIGNTHAYTADAKAPGADLYSWHLHHARQVTKSPKPLYSTETGYSVNSVSEWAQARYYPRLLTEHWRAGIKRTYLYELLDAEDNGVAHGGFGLCRADGTRRASFEAVKNMIAFFADPGVEFTPGSLDYSLSAGASTVRSFLLQKRNGDFYLVIWNDAKNFDLGTKSNLYNPDQAITLTINSVVGAVEVYEPLQSFQPTQIVRGNPKTVALSVPDQPIVVVLKPAQIPRPAWDGRVISLDFAFSSLMTPTEFAGYVFTNNWNSRTGKTATAVPLNDNSGAATTASASWNAYVSSNTFTTFVGADQKMMRGHIANDGTNNWTNPTVTITGIPYAQYDVIVYGDGFGTALTRYSAGGQILYTKDSDFFDYYQEGGSPTDLGATTPVSHYVRFRGLSGASCTIGASGTTKGKATITGLQIVEITGPAPVAPASFQAVPVSYNQVNLTWSNVAGETGYALEISADGNSFTPLAILPANTTSYSDLSRVGGASWTYRLRALGGAAGDASTLTTTAATPAAPAAPTDPSGLVATAPNSKEVQLQWADTSSNEEGFELDRSQNGTTFFTVARVEPGTTSYTDLLVSPVTSYTYRVRALNAGAGASGYATATVTTPQIPPPLAPTSLQATAAFSGQITLRWVDNSTNETGYKVLRSPDGVTYTLLASIGANRIEYRDQNLTPLTTYYYQVHSTNVGGDSVPASASATTGSLVRVISIDWSDASTAGFNTFTTSGMSATEVAGVAPYPNWNNGKTLTPLLDNTGASTTATVTYTAKAEDTAFGTINATSGDGHMLRAGIRCDWYPSGVGPNTRASSRPTITVSGIPYANYKVFVYSQTMGANSVHRFTIGAQSRFLRSASVNYNANPILKESLDTVDSGAATTEGNYVSFSNVTGSSFVLNTDISTALSGNYHWVTVSGIQIVEVIPNLAPSAAADSATLNEGSSSLIHVLANDSDPDSQPVALSIVNIGSPSGGTAVLESGRIRYTPQPGFYGADSFSYTITDGEDSAVATVSITVNNTASASDLTSAGLTGLNLGTTSTGSSRILADGTWEVNGAGTGLVGTSDGVRFEQKSVTGDFDLIVRVRSLTGSGPAPRAGLMLRESNAVGARMVYLSTQVDSTQFRSGARTTLNSQSAETPIPSPAYNYPDAWMLIRRSGDLLTLSVSSDDLTYTQVDQVTLAGLSREVIAGVFSSSGAVGSTTRAVFSDFEIVPASNTVAQWALDETTGAVANDSSGNGLDATLTGAPVWTAAGKVAGALSFNGSTQYGQVADSPLLDGTDRLSVSLWVKPTNLDSTSARFLVSKRVDTANANSYALFFHTGNKLFVDIDGLNNRFSSNTTFQNNVWYHIAMTYDGTAASNRVRLYVNGVLDRTAAETSAAIPDYASDLWIGQANAAYSTKFGGLLDEIYIIREVLTPLQIEILAGLVASEVIVDNTTAGAVTVTGAWTGSTTLPGFQGSNYLHDGNAGKGSKSVRFTPNLSRTATYKVYIRYTSDATRASNAPIDLVYQGGTDAVSLDQRTGGGTWVLLGTYNFAAGVTGSVTIGNAGTTGFVIADAVKFEPQ